MKKIILSLSILIAFSSSSFAFCFEKTERKEVNRTEIIIAGTGLACAMLCAVLGLIASYNQEASQN